MAQVSYHWHLLAEFHQLALESRGVGFVTCYYKGTGDSLARTILLLSRVISFSQILFRLKRISIQWNSVVDISVTIRRRFVELDSSLPDLKDICIPACILLTQFHSSLDYRWQIQEID